MTSNDLRAVAALLRIVAEAERARLEDDWARVATLLNAVDPVEADLLAALAFVEATHGKEWTNPRTRTRVEVLSVRTPW